jgi:hypothetical protein
LSTPREINNPNARPTPLATILQVWGTWSDISPATRIHAAANPIKALVRLVPGRKQATVLATIKKRRIPQICIVLFSALVGAVKLV